jgi:hypothetical protein
VAEVKQRDKAEEMIGGGEKRRRRIEKERPEGIGRNLFFLKMDCV